jgi:DNA repair protein RadC
MKPDSDTQRFLRYQRVLEAILSLDIFRKEDVYMSLDAEKRVFVGRIIGELEREGHLTKKKAKRGSVFSWSKNKSNFNMGRWIDQRVFTPSVKRSPDDQRPRERLLQLGPEFLKTSELLAILIRSGLQGESAVQAGEEIGARFGNDLQALSLKARGELKQFSKAIGETAYCQIMAALELGKRLAVQQKGALDKPYRIKSPASALAFCRRHFERLAHESAKEEFHVVLLDQAHQVIKTAQITVGITDKSLVHPREVFRLAIQESASALILVHNHPTGDPDPSQEDITITGELKAAAGILGLGLLDHIILGKFRSVSMKEEKLI